MSSNDKFESLIKEKLDSFEVPFNENHWAEFESKLDATGSGPTSATEWSTSGKVVAALSVITVGAILYFTLSDSSIESNENAPAQSEQSIVSVPADKVNEQPSNEEKSVAGVQEKSDKEEITDNEPTNVITKENKDSILESKINKYSDRSSTVMKEESKTFVAGTTGPSDAAATNITLDNAELRTSFSLSDKVACQGSEVTLIPDRIIEGATYFWSVNDGDLTVIGEKPVRKFNRVGNYTVTLIVSKGEKNDYKTSQSIEVIASPVVNFEWDSENVSLYDPYIEFTNLTQNATKFNWDINGQKLNDKNPDYIFKQHKGYFEASLTAMNNAGCESSKTIEIYVEKGSKMHVQNAFTPDGDGLNDVFIPEELKLSENSNVRFEFMIFDITNQMVFKTSDVSNPWNGQLNNAGESMPEGVYSWSLSTIDRKGASQSEQGQIILKRNQ